MTPLEISKAIPRELLIYGHHAEFFDIKDFSDDLQEDWYTGGGNSFQVVLDIALDHQHGETEDRPENQYWYLTKPIRDGGGIVYDVCLTEVGKKVREAFVNEWHCHADGELDEAKTIEYWLWQLNQLDPIRGAMNIMSWEKKHDWLKDDWAQPIVKAMTNMMRMLCVNPKGEPDYERSVNFWMIDGNSSHPFHKDRILQSNDDWIAPVQEHIVHQVLSA